MPPNSDPGLAPFGEVEPWETPITGEELVGALVAQLRRYVVADEHQLTAVALWIIFTHVHDCFDHSPILAVTAPTMRSGKTSLLNFLGKVVPRPLASSSVTQAVFRAINKWGPTLIADEADTYLKDNRNLVGVLNGGFDRHSAFVLRTTGENFNPQVFSTWGAKAIGAIGSLPPTVADRSIEIRLHRKRPDEHVERLSFHRLDDLTILARKLVRWGLDNAAQLGRDEPRFPPNITDRDADKWRPLLSIASLAGSSWLALATKAAVHLCSLDNPGEKLSSVERLIEDMALVFAARPQADFLESATIASALAAMADSPWFNQQGSFLQSQMASMLRPFGVRPRQKRQGIKNLRGYFRAEIVDLAARYGRPGIAVRAAATAATLLENRAVFDATANTPATPETPAATPAPPHRVENSDTIKVRSSGSGGSDAFGVEELPPFTFANRPKQSLGEPPK